MPMAAAVVVERDGAGTHLLDLSSPTSEPTHGLTFNGVSATRFTDGGGRAKRFVV